MDFHSPREKIRSDLQSPPELRRLGTGYLSGAAALIASLGILAFVLCLRFPTVLTVPQLRPYYDSLYFRLALHVLILTTFALACISLVLRTNKILGFSAVIVTLLATVLGGWRARALDGAANTGELFSGASLASTGSFLTLY